MAAQADKHWSLACPDTHSVRHQASNIVGLQVQKKCPDSSAAAFVAANVDIRKGMADIRPVDLVALADAPAFRLNQTCSPFDLW